MTANLASNGTDLDSIFHARVTAKRANVGYEVSGVDISNRYQKDGGTFPSATNFKTNAIDLNSVFIALGSYCACDCNFCACDCNAISCWTGDTLILMADGTEKRIDSIHSGDVVIGLDGVPVTVLAQQKVTRGNRSLYHIAAQNGRIVRITDEHPIMLEDRTWGVYNWNAFMDEMNYYHEGGTCYVIKDGKPHAFRNVYPEDEYLKYINADRRQIVDGDIFMTLDGQGVPAKPVFIDSSPGKDADFVYSLVTTGSHTYTVSGLISSGFHNNYDFDYKTGKPREGTNLIATFRELKEDETPEWLK